MKYIDAEKLIAEIERRLSIFEHGIAYSCWESCKKIVESLQQEQSEVDLEKEMDKDYDSPLWEGENVSWMTYTRIARHFFELGLNARKEK